MADVPALVRGLRSSRRTEQRRAALAIGQLSRGGAASGAAGDALIAAGCVPPLLHMLGSGSAALQVPAAGALQFLTTRGSQAKHTIAPGIPAFVALLGSEDGNAARCAATAVGNLACDSPERCAAIVAAGGHAALLRVSASSDAYARQLACVAIFNLALNEGTRAPVIAAGAFPALVGVLQRPASSASAGSAAFGGHSAECMAADAIIICACQPARAWPAGAG